MHKDVDEFSFLFVLFSHCSWRKVDISPLLEREDDDQEEEVSFIVVNLL